MVKIGIVIKDAKTGKEISKEEHEKKLLEQKQKEAAEMEANKNAH